MKYMGSRLKALLKKERGLRAALCSKLSNGKKDYNLDNLLKDYHNITLSTLSVILEVTGKTANFFVDFESYEYPPAKAEGVKGNNNIVNSPFSNDLTVTVEHLHEVVRLKDQLLQEKERVITMKDGELEQWKKRFDDLIVFNQLKNNGENISK